MTEWLTAEVFDFSSYAIILQCHLTMHILSKLKSKFTNITHISSSNRILCLTPKRFVKRNWKGNAVQCCNPVCGRVLESKLLFFEKGKRNVRNAEDVSKLNWKKCALVALSVRPLPPPLFFLSLFSLLSLSLSLSLLVMNKLFYRERKWNTPSIFQEHVYSQNNLTRAKHFYFNNPCTQKFYQVRDHNSFRPFDEIPKSLQHPSWRLIPSSTILQ